MYNTSKLKLNAKVKNMSIDMKMLKLYAKNGENVLLEGRHGVGKTEIIQSVFNDAFGTMEDDNWAYFSGSTMDAWVDFIGAPHPVDRGDGEKVLSLVKPARFAKGSTIKAIFIDELNRAPPKVLNALMELIQFKSINGVKFEKLEVIWAAINPEDEEENYSVNKLDPAQKDRFTVQIKMPYNVSKPYFSKKHGQISVPFITWWKGLTKEVQYDTSPRRLDKSISVHSYGGDLRDVLPKESNVTELLKLIKEHNSKDEWVEINKQAEIEMRVFLQNPQKIEQYKEKILSEPDKYINLISEDYLCVKIDALEVEWVRSLKNIKLSKSIESHINKVHTSLDELIEKVNKNINKFNTSNININGKIIVITGKFVENYKNYSNSQSGIADLIKANGGMIENKVTRNTDYVIYVDVNSFSSKAAAGRKHQNVTMVSESDFHQVYGNK